MYVELIVDGVIKRSWYYENADFFEPFCEAGHEERKAIWNRIVTECRDKASGLIYQAPFEMNFNIKAKIQPKDIPDEEYWEFVRMLEEKQSNPISKIKRRFV